MSTANNLLEANSTAQAAEKHRLSAAQAEQFHQDGYLAPLTACTPEAMAHYRKHIEAVLETEGIGGHGNYHNRHLDDRLICELATLPSIVGPMQSILGENLALWRTNYFIKDPGGKEIPWHQDRNYWPLEPEIIISAWLAIDRATIENSCVQVIPGTHRKLIKHIPSPKEMAFEEMADTDRIDLDKRVHLELEPGQFILFNERTLHHSEKNNSNLRRIGMAIRVITPQVRVLDYDSEQHGLIRISGEDTLGFNRYSEPPT